MNPTIASKSVEKLIMFLLIVTFIIVLGAETLVFYYPSNLIMDHFISLMAFSNFVIVIIVVKWLFNVKYMTLEFSMQQQSVNYMEEVIKIMRSERHEFANHLLTIMGLIKSGEHKEVMTYLKDIGAGCLFNNQVVSVSNPTLRVLLQNKRQSAVDKGIDFKLTVQSHLKSLQLNPGDITIVFGNLLDNAMDSIINAKDSSNKKFIVFKIVETDDYYIFTVQDSGPPIDDKVLLEIFKVGFSTKGSGRGFGLALVQNVLTRYNGRINYDDNPIKVFTVTIPRKEVMQ